MWLVILALFVVGCAAAAQNKEPEPDPEPEPEPAPPEPPPPPKQYPVSFAIDPTDEKLITAFTYAMETWNTALDGEWITIKTELEGEVPVLWVETVTTEGGCVQAAD